MKKGSKVMPNIEKLSKSFSYCILSIHDLYGRCSAMGFESYGHVTLHVFYYTKVKVTQVFGGLLSGFPYMGWLLFVLLF